MLNSLQIIGRVGKDPEIRYLPNGDAVASISVATTEKWKDKQSGERKEDTEWHRVSAFGKLAEIIGEYVKKGALIYIEGKVKTRKYTDKDGIEKYATEVRANDMKMLSGKQDGDAEQRPAQQRPAQREPQRQKPPASQQSGVYESGFDDMEDDIPFATASMHYDMTTSKQRRMLKNPR